MEYWIILGNTVSSHPVLRLAVISHKLARLVIDIAAISEVQFPEGSLQYQGDLYTFCLFGNLVTECRLSDISVMVRISIASKFEDFINGDHIICMRFLLQKQQHTVLFCVYFLTPDRASRKR